MLVTHEYHFVQFATEAFHPPQSPFEFVLIFGRSQIVADDPPDLVFEFLNGDRVFTLIQALLAFGDKRIDLGRGKFGQ